MKSYRIMPLLVFILVILLSSGSFVLSKQNYDYFDRNLALTKEPKRIVSLSPATTEILFSLGLGDRIAGVTTDCNFPEAAKKKEKVGKFGFINLEKLVSLKPDLILATSDMNQQLDVLEKFKIPVVALNTPDIEAVLKNIEIIGNITGKERKAAEVISDLSKRFEKVKIKTKSSKKPKLFYVIWNDPLITAGGKSFIGDLITQAGGKNIAEKINTPFAKYSIESLVAANPDYILIPHSTYKNMNFSASPWNRLKAIKNKNVLAVDDDIYQRPAPRIIDALEEVQKFINE